ncbi:MAG: glucose-1-phosphate thymidylyltransferase RfbA [Simkaniaceae bacterium]
MKGILLAGGMGSRLYPITMATCKQLLPVYDKPMIYYPLSILMLSGIREILIISMEKDIPRFQALFGDGSHLGLSIAYAKQDCPNGIAEAFIIGESFINNDSVCLILGDNIFYGNSLETIFQDCCKDIDGGRIFGYQVKNPSRYGVIDLDENGKIRNILEKPRHPPSPFAVTGLYYYDNQVIDIAKSLKPSDRGELEITDVNRAYLGLGRLKIMLFDKGFAWLDTGTPEALAQASGYVQTIQERQGIKIACLEEIAYQRNFITLEMLEKLASLYTNTDYGDYLKEIVLREENPLFLETC